MGIGAAGLDLQGVIECVDGFRKFSQIQVGSRLKIECIDVVGVLSNRAVEITDGITETPKMVEGKAFPQPGISVFRFQLQGLVKGKNCIAVPFQGGVGFSLVVKCKGIFRVMDKGFVERLERFLVPS